MSEVKKLGATAEDVTKVAKGITHGSVRKFLDKFEAERENIVLLVNGDSTGNDYGEWVYLLAQHYATNTRYRVVYYMWDESTNDYMDGDVLSDGENGKTLSIFNFSIGGSKVNYILGANKFDNGLVALKDTDKYPDCTGVIDLVLINHSHNVWTYTKVGDTLYLYKQFMDKLLQYFPAVSVVMLKQSPWRDDFDNEERVQVAMDFAAKYNIGIANVWDKYVAKDKADYLYIDSIHPTTGLGDTGTQLHLDAVLESLAIDTARSDSCTIKYSFSGQSIANNTDLTAFTADTIDGFTLTNVTVEEVTDTYFNPKKGSSLKLRPSEDGSSSYIKYTIGLPTHLRGRTFLAEVAMFKAATSSITKGRVSLYSSSSSGIPNGNLNTDGVWTKEGSLLTTRETDTYISLIIYLNSSADTTTTDDVLYLDSFDIKLVENA